MKKLGYYRTDDASDGILLSDGRREMADSEFGTGSNAEKVIIILQLKNGLEDIFKFFHYHMTEIIFKFFHFRIRPVRIVLLVLFAIVST